MLSINLLPPEEKKAYEREQWSRVAMFLGFSSCAILAVGITFLLPSFLPLMLQRQELKRARNFIEGFSPAINTQKGALTDRRLKELIQTAQSVSREERFGRLGDAAFGPHPGVSVESFLIEKERMTITGRAKTRKNLLAFEQSLKNSGLFQDVSSPLSNIIRETDNRFTISAFIRLQETKSAQ